MLPRTGLIVMLARRSCRIFFIGSEGHEELVLRSRRQAAGRNQSAGRWRGECGREGREAFRKVCDELQRLARARAAAPQRAPGARERATARRILQAPPNRRPPLDLLAPDRLK
mmetsp:Transcript_161/g.412  ORF Transcript_161/g.412 Transcript_161/m.412 type:complete len:113 (+) Transcript_161:46-384(+)